MRSHGPHTTDHRLPILVAGPPPLHELDHATALPQQPKTIFRLEPGARTSSAVPDITPLLLAFGGQGGPLQDGCTHEAMFRITAAMANNLPGR